MNEIRNELKVCCILQYCRAWRIIF
jgi:hypothetical protein